MKSKLVAVLRLGVGGVVLSVPLGAHALTFELGKVNGNFDTTVSLGASMRVQDPDDKLVGITNGGSSRSVNDDDGNLNYESGDLISTAIKATHDLEVKYGPGGVFSRVTYFYDFQADSDDEFFGRRGEDRLVSEFDLLDLFAYTNFKVIGRNVSVRAGKQVVNWGESTFIGNSLNSVNPVDVAKLRTPGAELKEALLPIPMLFASTSLSSSLSVEGLWIWSFQETEIDPRGSFFSTTDLVSDDADRAFVGFGRRDDQHAGPPADPTMDPEAAVFVPRDGNKEVKGDTQQYGFALRYFADWLNSTEFGLFYLNYHSRTPLISAVRGGPAPGPTTNALNGALPTCSQSTTAAPSCRATYFAEYPRNIELYGLSFNTDGPLGIALQGEYSYRPNLPVQRAATEVLFAAVGAPNNVTGTSFVEIAPGMMAPVSALVPRGTVIEGYERIRSHQVQTTFTKAFGPTLAAEQFVVVSEFGYTHLELPDDVLFNGPATHLPSCTDATPTRATSPSLAASAGSCQEEAGGGYADRSSWGYRLVTRMDFENAIGPAQLSPRLVFGHDVNGVGPAFNQETKAVTVGLGMNYLQRWQADLGYTAFFGGRTYSGTDTLSPAQMAVGQTPEFASSANPNKDRDFVALSVSYAF